jgi:translation initiation factor IF-3
MPKNLELNWAIAGGDLKHRLERLKEFLREGRKVEILLGPKKRGKKATEQEANAVIKAVRDAAGECKGASEVKAEGTVGAVMTVVFEGRKIEEKKEEPKEP